MRPSRQRERAKQTRFFFSLGLLLFLSFFLLRVLGNRLFPRLLIRGVSEGNRMG